MFRNHNVHSDQGNERLWNVSKVYNIRYHGSDVICDLVYFDCSYSVLFSQSNASVFMFTETSATVHYHWSWQKKKRKAKSTAQHLRVYDVLCSILLFCFGFYLRFLFRLFSLWGRPKDIANCMHLTCYSLEICKDMSLLQKMRVCGLYPLGNIYQEKITGNGKTYKGQIPS